MDDQDKVEWVPDSERAHRRLAKWNATGYLWAVVIIAILILLGM